MPNKVITFFLGLMLLVSVGSCSVDSNDFSFEYIPVLSVYMPNSFTIGQRHTIEYKYYRPSSCHVFNDLFLSVDSNVRTVAVINTVFSDNNGQPCEDLNDVLIVRTFHFTPTHTEPYLFRFWQGMDSAGEDVYLEFEVPVNN